VVTSLYRQFFNPAGDNFVCLPGMLDGRRRTLAMQIEESHNPLGDSETVKQWD
jgi:hypothetical protein